MVKNNINQLKIETYFSIISKNDFMEDDSIDRQDIEKRCENIHEFDIYISRKKTIQSDRLKQKMPQKMQNQIDMNNR